MSSLPTLVCVHAHPDDEAFFAAGASAYYAQLGHRVVLITCTTGRLGFDSAHREGSQADHDGAGTVATRAGELQRSVAILGLSRAVNLGYEDSGMAGWDENKNPDAFTNVDVEAVARTIASILDEEDAKVVVTYDEHGFYGHPDHIQANVVTRRAVELASGVERLYYSVVPQSNIARLLDGAKEQGLDMPSFVLDASTHVSDELIATTMDLSAYAGVKRAAMTQHASQIDNADLVEMNEALFSLLFGTEYYQRAWSRHDTTDDTTDLFGGL